MTNHRAIWMALDLLRSPSSVKVLRGTPLPTDVSTVLGIAAGDEQALKKAIEATRVSPKSVREAAAFYIEQILFYPNADHYRVLGARPDASNAELRRNMALLIRWLHPDQQNGAERTIFAARVTRAWSDLKTEERRAAYDQGQRRVLANKSLSKKTQSAQQRPTTPRTSDRGHPSSRQTAGRHPNHPGILMRLLLMIAGRNLH
jgi:hypothetical protein